MATKVVMKCLSKKESVSHSKENPITTAIELEVPYGEQNIYWKMSGGTNWVLNTVNKAAAGGFNVGDEYEIIISPVEK